MVSTELVIHVTVAVAATIVLIALLAPRLGNKKVGWTVGLGLVLYTLGIYFFPLGAIEAYDWTGRAFDLSSSWNAVLWYVLTTLLIVGGIFLAFRKRRASA